MDSVLESAWREYRAPFDGDTVFSSEPLSVDNLVPTLRLVVNTLKDHVPQAELCELDDWHEHDGVDVGSTPSSWPTFLDYLSSPEVFTKRLSDDTHVKLGLYDIGGTFYLRAGCEWHVGQQTILPTLGTFDLTCGASLIRTVRAVLASVNTDTMSAKAFFARTYAGP